MIQFFVPGLPKTAGSKRAFMRPGMKFPVVVDDCAKSKDWKADVKAFARGVAPAVLLNGPLKVTFRFVMPRPKGHFRSGRNSSLLRDSAPSWPITKPDLLKMARAVEDALTSVIYNDDSQIVDERLLKEYGEKPGVAVEIWHAGFGTALPPAIAVGVAGREP